MRWVRVHWKGKTLEGLMVAEGRLRLENGYEVILDGFEILEEREVNEQHMEMDEGSGDVVLVSTGGTIASYADYNTGAVKPIKNIKYLIERYDFLKGVEVRSFMNIFSENMLPEYWEKLAKAVYEWQKDGKEVVIMHGTDTMSYTGAALSLALGKPITSLVMTGSQRSSDRPSTDAYENLKVAVMAARSRLGYPLVSFHTSTSDKWIGLHLASRIRKMHTSRRDAIRSVGHPPVFMADWRLAIIKRVWNPSFTSESWLKPAFNPNIEVIYYYPGKTLEFEPLSKRDAVVILGTGLGHINKKDIPVVKQLVESDVPVAITSQCIDGPIHHWVYTTGRQLLEAGAVGHLTNMVPETAIVKTMWITAQVKGVKAFRQLYETNIAGEIQPPVPMEAFPETHG